MSTKADDEHDDGFVLVHSIVLDVRWGDLDALGHLNNTVYFRFMEQARAQWLHEIGHPLRAGTEGVVIITASCTFRRAINYPARVRVDMFCAAPGRSSFPTRYELRDADEPERLYAEGSATAVWVDHVTEQSRPLPAAMRAQLPASR